MPNVPRVPGVPNLSSYSTEQFVFLVADLVLSALGLLGPQWGIFLNGEQAIDFDSIKAFDYRQDWSISDYPTEAGSFQSYNKVQHPFDVRVRLASDGTMQGRQALLRELEYLANSLELFDIVTPEKVFADVNCSHYDFRRSADRGIGMIIADLWFTEIRQTAEAQFSNTQSPTTAGKQNIGNVQIKPVGDQVSQNFDNGTWAVG